jgi:thioredoxin 1
VSLPLHEFNWKKEVLQASEPVLVDSWASWCPACRAMNHVIGPLARYGLVRISQDSFEFHPHPAARP